MTATARRAPARPLPPLRFGPAYRHAPWGGGRLPAWLGPGLRGPGDGPVAEAWALSDCPRTPSRVLAGPHRGRTLGEVLAAHGRRLVGPHADPEAGFPLLLKFLDAREPLSVQVHPDDAAAARLAGCRRGKSEAWVVLAAKPGARAYAGLKPGVRPECLGRAAAAGRVVELLHEVEPRPGDCLFLPAGTVHALGAGLTVFEVQQACDLTYRLYDWGRPRPLQVEEALACADFARGPVGPAVPVVESAGPVVRERLVSCEHFGLWRVTGDRPFAVGAPGRCRAVVAIGGEGEVTSGPFRARLRPGGVVLFPADAGPGVCVPTGGPVTVLEVGLPGDCG